MACTGEGGKTGHLSPLLQLKLYRLGWAVKGTAVHIVLSQKAADGTMMCCLQAEKGGWGICGEAALVWP